MNFQSVNEFVYFILFHIKTHKISDEIDCRKTLTHKQWMHQNCAIISQGRAQNFITHLTAL